MGVGGEGWGVELKCVGGGSWRKVGYSDKGEVQGGGGGVLCRVVSMCLCVGMVCVCMCVPV